ncbi:phytanoyl-CoA dioxygenase family protein [Paenibacillaceae bacterium]|nr:phytanoyl-CoA dioxygenase family protein [Paenibacillaceae bacterium]
MTTAQSPEELSRVLYRYDQLANKLQRVDEIGEEQVENYRKDGYLAIEQLYSAEEVKKGIEALGEIMFGDTKGAKLQFTRPMTELNTLEDRELALRKIENFTAGHESLHAIAYNSALIKTVEAILGEPAKLVQEMALLKPPHGGGEKPWHQDMAYGNLAYDKAVVGVWIALDDAALDNGCMHVIPGSHADGATPHYSVRDWQICDSQVPVERDVAIPLQPGGLMLFHGLLKHGTPYNLSDKRRRALQFHYAGESAEKLRPKEYKRFFTNEMTGAEC